MSGLLKADFYRIKKSKLLTVVLILCAAFPLITALLYFAIFKLDAVFGGSATDLFPFNGRFLLSSSFSLSNNLGIVIPVFSGIYMCKDISDGTLRNKVINGNSRTKIYFSHLFSGMVFNIFSILLFAFFNVLFGSLFLGGYGVELNGAEWKYIGALLLMGVLTFAFVATITAFLAMVLKNMAITMILTVAYSMLSSLTSLLDLGLIDFGKYKPLLYFIPGYTNSTIGSLSSLFGLGGLEKNAVLFGIISYIFFGLLNTVLGIAIFNKKDLK